MEEKKTVTHRCTFVQQNHTRISDQSQADTQFAFVASAVGPCELVSVGLERQTSQETLHIAWDALLRDELDPRVQSEMLPSSEFVEESIELWTVAWIEGLRG